MHVWNLALSSRIGLTPAERSKRGLSVISPYSITSFAWEQWWRDTPIPRSPTFPVKLGSGISV